MSRSSHFGQPFFDPRFVKGWRLQKATWVPVDNAVFDLNLPSYLELNPGGAVDVLLPDPQSTDATLATHVSRITGMVWLLSNVSAATVTFKSSADVAFTTAVALATLKNGWLICTGNTTPALGWRMILSA